MPDTTRPSLAPASPVLQSLPPRAPRVVIRPQRGLFDLELGTIWAYRQLLYFFAWRDVKVRYKQTLIGAGWAIIQPLTTMVIFTLIFGKFARIPSDGLPYAVFSYSGLITWNFFATALHRSSVSVIGDGNLIDKIYFPRLIMPLAGPLSGLVDFGIGVLILLGLMGWYGFWPAWTMLVLPLFILLALATALAVGLFLAALNVRFRDVGYTVPFIVQVWMYSSPIVYPVSLVPERWRFLNTLNPMAGVIEGVRWAMFGGVSLDPAA